MRRCVERNNLQDQGQVYIFMSAPLLLNHLNVFKWSGTNDYHYQQGQSHI